MFILRFKCDKVEITENNQSGNELNEWEID